MPVYRIFRKYGCAGKTEYLRIHKELHDVLMAVTKVTAVAFVKNHHDTRVADFVNLRAVPCFANGCIEFLYRGDDNFGIALETFNQLIGIVCAIHSTGLKRLIFRLRLRVKVMPVYHKHHFIHIVQF